ncbi:MAG TPA: hypothetical protein VGE07_23890 [Herpetosiphonaceae bacterium]
MSVRRIGAIAILALTAACGSVAAPPPSQPTGTAAAEVTGGEFEGFYSLRFEVSSFAPCGSGEEAGYGKGYWLDSDPNLNWARRYEAALAQTGGAITATAAPMSGEPVYVRVIADLSPPSPDNYGHLNMYEREIRVTQILEMSREGRCKE